MTIAELMNQYLKSNGYRFTVIADKAGIQHSRFYRLMSGISPLTVDEYEVICARGLNIDPGYFFKLKSLKTNGEVNDEENTVAQKSTTKE